MTRLILGERTSAPCSGRPIYPTLEALEERWSLIVIRDLMFGNRRHFREVLTRSEERITLHRRRRARARVDVPGEPRGAPGEGAAT
jgi:hypothetical protein